jgi:hypothetical protein
MSLFDQHEAMKPHAGNPVGWNVPQPFESVRENLLAAWKLALSFRKQNWELGDYPIVIRKQSIDPLTEETTPRIQQYRYLARIVKWWILSANGNTAADAMRELVIQF